MTYEEWNAAQDWWKGSTEDVFEKWWIVLEENSCWRTDDIAEMFDDTISAMRNEYGE